MIIYVYKVYLDLNKNSMINCTSIKKKLMPLIQEYAIKLIF